jgi:preprotein translocase subunit SecG
MWLRIFHPLRVIKMELVFLVIQIVIAVLLVGAILLQRTDSDGLSGLSGGSGTMGGVMSHKSANRFLVRVTTVLGIAFFINSLILANIAHQHATPESLVDQVETAPAAHAHEKHHTEGHHKDGHQKHEHKAHTHEAHPHQPAMPSEHAPKETTEPVSSSPSLVKAS